MSSSVTRERGGQVGGTRARAMTSSGVLAEVPNANYHKYHSCVFIVTRQEMYRIYLWLYKGSPSQHVEEYIRTQDLLGRMRLGRHEKMLLDKKESVAKFDISFLYKLLQFTCGLSSASDKIWNEPTASQENSLEHILYRLKTIRNSLSHENDDLIHMSHETLKDRTEELSQLITMALELAGEMVKRRDEAARYIDKVKTRLQVIIEKPIPSGITPQEFSILGKQEMRKLCSAENGAFAEVVIQQAQRTATTTTSASVPELRLNQLLQWSCEDTKLPDVILVSGDTGTGKTSLCRHIFDSWLSGDAAIADLQDCDLVVPIQCSGVTTRDVVQLLRDYLPQTVKTCGPYEVLDTLSSLKVVWLVDGYEEATHDARELLKCLMEKRGTLHTIIATSRPEHSIEILTHDPENVNVLEARLLGLSVRGRGMVVEKLLQEAPTSTKRLEDFESELSRLNSEVSRELLNPLKLTLIVNLWKEDLINMKEGGTLPQLYSAIKQRHIHSLCEKTRTKTGMIEEECKRKVNIWVEALCEEAFNMTYSHKFTHLSAAAIDTLRKACDRQHLFSEDCFSTFLGYQPSDTKSGLACYAFLHNTQQFHYAAEHVLLHLSESTNKVSAIYQIFGGETPGEIGSQLYMVLLHVMALLSASGDIEEELAAALVKLLSHCDRCLWFEVIRYAAYSEDVVSEVSKRLPAGWGVGDDDVKAVKLCLNYRIPKDITIILNNDPNGNEEFIPMAEVIAQKEIIINLSFRYLFPNTANIENVNAILEILCSKDAVCHIVMFEGCVSDRGCSYICKMPKLRNLTLKILKNKDLGLILKMIERLKDLELFKMIMVMPQLSLKKGLAVSDVRLEVYLPLICDYNIHKAVDSLNNISKKYDKVCIYQTSPKQNYTLITELKRKKVKIGNVEWVLKESNGSYSFPLGSVLFTYSYDVFEQLSNIMISVAKNTNITAKVENS